MTDDIRRNINTSPPPKKSKGPFIAIIALILVVGFGAYAYASGIIGGGNKNQRVSEALTSVFDGEDNAFTADWLGQEELAEAMQDGFSSSGKLELVSTPALESVGVSLPKGMMLSFESASNGETGATSGRIGLGLMGSSLLNADYYMDDSKLQLAVPALFDEIIAADFSGDLAAKIENAPLFEGALDEEMLAEIRAIPQAMSESQEFSQRWIKVLEGDIKLEDYPALHDALTKFRDSWVVEEVEAKTMVWNGSENNFDGFHVTIEKEAVVTLFNDLKTVITTDEKLKEDFVDYFANQVATSEGKTTEEAYAELDAKLTEWIEEVQADEDFTNSEFTIHMTKDNVLTSLSTEFKGDDTEGSFLWERYGGDFPNQNMKMVLTAQGDDKGELEFVSTGNTEGDVQTRDLSIKAGGNEGEPLDIQVRSTLDKAEGSFTGTMTLVADDDEKAMNAGLEYNGTIEDVVKGQSGTYVLDELKLTLDGEVQVELKGELKYTTEDVTVAPLEGTELDLFTATEEDLEDVMNQIMSNVGLLMQLLGGGLGF